MQKKIDLLSQLLLELEADVGTSETTFLVLRSLQESLRGIKIKTNNELHTQLQELVNVVCSTTPRFGILNHYFQRLLCAFEEKIQKVTHPHQFLRQEIEKILKQIQGNKKKLLEYSEQIPLDGKTILVHDHSHTVHDVLRHLKSKGKKFEIIIAEQEHEKTEQNIEVLHEAGIPFHVVPAYMLSHIHDRVDMVFFGALTLKNTMEFVMDPGTHGVISEFHMTQTPIYCFVKTSKFSLWESKERGEIFFHRHTRSHGSRPIEYERIKYSHDRVPAKLFSSIVTNEGIFTFPELKKLFQTKLKEIAFCSKT
ncbi:translation initiation factor eIF-2B [Candidatus Gracilibacteria bacterium]|nr:translation initiation factor eIF-2B [Candidatus Gracilibacteria bacterium]